MLISRKIISKSSKENNIVFKIDAKGDVFCSDDKQFSDIVKKPRCKIENDVRNTKEFLEVMDNSLELTAVDLNAPYKKLLEYNDTAGTKIVAEGWGKSLPLILDLRKVKQP